MTMTIDRITHRPLSRYQHPSPRPSFWADAATGISNLVTTLLDWQDRAHQRRQLLALGDGALKDFGRNRADAVHEGDKPFWRA